MTLPEPTPDLLRGASLFLDFDGTLVELAEAPDAVVVPQRLRDVLERLAVRLENRIVLVSGRASADVRERLLPLELGVAGSHGLESMGGEVPERPAALDHAADLLRPLTSALPGMLLEEKPLGVALHFRQAPHAEEQCRDAAERAAAATGLVLQPGKMVFELKPEGGDKGAALRRFMARAPFAGTRPVFVGDDLTDEHGFAAAAELGGAGVLVGEERETAASHRLGDVDAVHRWLEQAVEALA